jgi:succinate-semialdehyde dehydrogenase/glutarate-semialdehyde dehydrogenase
MDWIKNLNDPTLLNAVIAQQGNTTLAQFDVSNPYDNTLIATLAQTSFDDINHVIDLAETAQKEWRKKNCKVRATLLHKWFELVMTARDDLATIMTMEQGKPLTESVGEVSYGASFIEWFSEEAKRSYGETMPSPIDGRQLSTIKQPIGVAAAITPWNFPIAMITRKAAPALAAGCAFISRPAANTPLCALAIAELAYRAGIPKSLFAVICTPNADEVGKLFCAHPKIRKLSFTGSTRVGKQLMAQSAQQVQKVSMELGGNAPFIVMADADIDAAVQGAIACKFRNAGQTCVCANRFYIADEVYDEFIEKFVNATSRLIIGNGLDKVQIGPLIDANAISKVSLLLNMACENGAEIAAGGAQDPQHPNVFQPTVLVNVRHTNPIMQQEIFGPIAPCCRFTSIEQVIEWSNDTDYGLAAYFYSQNINTIHRLSHELEFGIVGINEGIISTEVAPFGGVKQSGIGREGGKQGLDEYLETKYLCLGGLAT